VSSLLRWPNELGLIANQFKLLAETGRSDEALAWHDAHPELQVPATWMLRGTLLTQNGHHREAAKAFRRAFDGGITGEERFAAGYQLAIALVRTQRFAEARTLIDHLLIEFPERSELIAAKQLLAEQAD
jgi:tetratricopeptide (TPR) repeat protein